MKARDAVILFVVVTAGALAALLAWSLIVKSQLSAVTSGNSTLGTLATLLNVGKSA